jgi:UDP-GlcNAc:undecaprenyl-phosphate GlcNAc-1-phosphate transferase
MAGVEATIGIRELSWSAGKAFLISLVLTPIVRDIFRAYNVVDRPGIRKVHAYPIPRLGGISIAAAYVIGLAGLLVDRTLAWQLLPGATVIFFTGILDDFFNLTPLLKLVGQVIAACIAFAGGLRVPGVPDWLSFVLTIGWLLFSSNAFNLVDGLDGLCGGMGLVATLAGFTFASVHGDSALQYATLPLAAAILGFLCHNFSRATVFLGDSGALLIGFLVGCFSLMWANQATGVIGIIAPVLAMSLPVMDVLLSIARRFLQGKKIFSPDRGHIHHRLLDRGFTPQRAVSVLYLWAAAGAVFALLLSYDPLRSWQWLPIAGFCVTTSVGVKELRYSEFNMAARMLIGGEFRRTLQAKTRMENLASALECSRTEDDWWLALVSAARDAGWSAIEWLRDDSVRREKVFPDQSPSWSFTVTLTPDEKISVQGGLDPGPQPDLVAFARSVQVTFAERSKVWEQPKLT